MTPVITLTTDFGDRGPYVAVMKAVIWRDLPDARIVDLSHGIPPFWSAEAGFWLERCYRYFPAGTVHVAVVDPGVGSDRRIIAAEHDGHVFLAPDNGFLPLVLGRDETDRGFELSADWCKRRNWPAPSRTFHGRDLFAPLAAGIAAGTIRLEEIGPPAGALAAGAVQPAQARDGEARGQVIAIDRWGNLLSNIPGEWLAGFRRPQVRLGAATLPVVRTYADAAPGTPVALVNSFGVVEVAVAAGDAARVLGARHGDAVSVRDT